MQPTTRGPNVGSPYQVWYYKEISWSRGFMSTVSSQSERCVFVSGNQNWQGYEFCSVQRTTRSNACTPICKYLCMILRLKLMHYYVVEYKVGLLMVLFLPLNRYLQYVHLQLLQGLLVMCNSHLIAKKCQMWLNLNTHILSGEIYFIYWLQTDIIMDFDESSVHNPREVGDGVQYCVCVCVCVFVCVGGGACGLLKTIINTGLLKMIVRVLTTCHTQYTWDSSICIFLFNRTTLKVFVTYLTGALYVHPLWLYKHQHDNRVHSERSVACQWWWFQWQSAAILVNCTPSGEMHNYCTPHIIKENFENFLIHRCNYILLSQVYCVWQVVKTPTIVFNNPVLCGINNYICWTINWKGFGRKWLWYNQSTVLAFAWGVWGKAWSILSQDTKCPVCDTNRTHPTWSLECCYVCSVGFQKCRVSSTGPLLYEPETAGLVGCVCVCVVGLWTYCPFNRQEHCKVRGYHRIDSEDSGPMVSSAEQHCYWLTDPWKFLCCSLWKLVVTADWTVQAPVVSNDATDWAVQAPVVSNDATGWAVQAPAVESDVADWAVQAPLVESDTTDWTVQVPMVSNGTTGRAVQAVVVESDVAGWAVQAPVVSNDATGWAVQAPVVSNYATGWAVQAPLVSNYATGWGAQAPVVSNYATGWAVQAPLVSNDATGWAVQAPVVESDATGWAVQAPVVSNGTTGRAVQAPVVESDATGWAVQAPLVSNDATGWAVQAPAVESDVADWAVQAAVVESDTTDWTVQVPMVSNDTTGRAVQAAVVESDVADWAVQAPVVESDVADWAVQAPVVEKEVLLTELSKLQW